MKKIFISAFAGLLCLCTSCDNKAVTSADDGNKEQAQKNLAASEVVMKAFQTGDASGIDSVIADDFVDHTERGDMRGKDSLKSMIAFVHKNYGDMKFEKIRDVADGDYVYNWLTYSGTGDGTMGMPKGPYKFSGIELTKFQNGKAVEHWGFMDMQDAMKMMSQQPVMSNADTTKKK